MRKILETQRLYLRELEPEDYGNLREMLQDAEVMYAYEHAFSDEEVHEWLMKQLIRYERDGFGLWAVIRKSDETFLGQVGITMQKCDQEWIPEIGYLLKKKFWHQGYATEAALGCKDYAFQKLGCPYIYSIIRTNNIPSQQVAKRLGMTSIKIIHKYYYHMDMPHIVFGVENTGEHETL
jgi:ribosomal-protein-alanine N-acetyltransferase